MSVNKLLNIYYIGITYFLLYILDIKPLKYQYKFKYTHNNIFLEKKH